MRLKHIIQRGNHYHFVCRIPQDLRHFFPIPVIWKAIKAGDAKSAHLLGNALEYRTQKLFLQLRSRMLDKDLEKRLVSEFLQHGIEVIEDKICGNKPKNESSDGPIEKLLMRLCTEAEKREIESDKVLGMGNGNLDEIERSAIFYTYLAKSIQNDIALKKTDEHESMATAIIALHNYFNKFEGKSEIKPTKKELTDFSLKLMNARKKLFEVESATIRGEWTPLETLKEKVVQDLKQPYCDFETIIGDYKRHYRSSKSHLKPGTVEDMDVECRVLLEIIGNISINDVNTLRTITKLKEVLLKYPKNRIQKFGCRPIHKVIKEEKNYEIINPKTANEYIKRLKAILDFAIKAKLLHTANVAQGENFKINSIPEEERRQYDKEEIEKLVDALCTRQLYDQNENKNDRFWIILIALLQGFRLSNIVNLSKDQVTIHDDIACFDFLPYGLDGVKTKNALKRTPVHYALVEIGFLEWVKNYNGVKLFKDSSSQFSKWYNRRDGKHLGFEMRYITTDKKKCLYSLRHNHTNALIDAGVDYKIIKESMGHAPDKTDLTRFRYGKHSSPEKIADAFKSMSLDGLDLERLRTRAIELFDLSLP